MNLRFATMTAAVALMLFTPIAGYAQDAPVAPAGPAPAAPADTAQNTPATAPGTVAPSAVNTKSDTYTQQQLDQMLAPVALYPDQLVSQILMASTFPLQIVEAARWLGDPKNAALKGDALVAALQPMNWDPSVKSVTAFPAIVTMLNKNLEWTDSLGVAFTHQQGDVMAQIQFLRHQAQKAGNLVSNDKIVCREDGANIVIAPANPRVVYAPYYNPAVVYGTWPWTAYPPVYFPPRYFGLGPVGFQVAWAWGPAWPIVPAFWGWQGVNWGTGGGIYINSGGYSQIAYRNASWGGGNWQHPGGPISHGGFSNIAGAGSVQSSVSHASQASSGQLGSTRASGGHQSGVRAGVNHQGGGGGHQGTAHASRGHGGGGHQGTAHASRGHGGEHQGGGGHQGATNASRGHGGEHQGGGGHQGAANASRGHGGGEHHGGGGHQGAANVGRGHGGGEHHGGGGHQAAAQPRGGHGGGEHQGGGGHQGAAHASHGHGGGEHQASGGHQGNRG